MQREGAIIHSSTLSRRIELTGQLVKRRASRLAVSQLVALSSWIQAQSVAAWSIRTPNHLKEPGRALFNLAGTYLALVEKQKPKAGPKHKDQVRVLNKVARELFDLAYKTFRAGAKRMSKNTSTRARLVFFSGLALYYAGRYARAEKIFIRAQRLRRGASKRAEALEWRISALSELVRPIRLPDDPVPEAKKKVVRRVIPPLIRRMQGALQEFIKLYPRSTDTRLYTYLLATYFYRYRHFTKAKVLFRMVLVKHCRSRYAWFAGNYLKTILAIEKPPRYLDRFEALVVRMRKKRCGREILCRKGDPRCTTAKWWQHLYPPLCQSLLLEIWRERAHQKLHRNDCRAARSEIRKIVVRCPRARGLARLHFGLARCEMKRGRYRSAISLFRQQLRTPAHRKVAARGMGRHWKPWLNDVLAGMAEASARGLDFSAALDHYRKLHARLRAKRKKGKLGWHLGYARMLRWQGKPARAARVLFRARRLFPAGRATLALAMGRTREQQRRWHAMRKAYLEFARATERRLGAKRPKMKATGYYKKHPEDLRLAFDLVEALRRVLARKRALRLGQRGVRRLEDRILGDVVRFRLPPGSHAAHTAGGIALARARRASKRRGLLQLRYPRIGAAHRRRLLSSRGAVLPRWTQQTVRLAAAALRKQLATKLRRLAAGRARFSFVLWRLAFALEMGRLFERAHGQLVTAQLPEPYRHWGLRAAPVFDDPRAFYAKLRLQVLTRTVLGLQKRWRKQALQHYGAVVARARKLGLRGELTRQARRGISRLSSRRSRIIEAKIAF